MKKPLANLALGAALLAPVAAFAAMSTPMRLGDGVLEHGIKAGMTADEVREVAGAPASSKTTGDHVDWTYNYVDTSGMRSIYDVRFDSSGRVASASRLRLSY
ncbi:MAG TPA: outer membrane protein assembly factor BamE [Usitatibacter sp.]|jgi:hypothetical protein|nr:outer membrane protein assembly factor BamE [Usitatibacter sp.]